MQQVNSVTKSDKGRGLYCGNGPIELSGVADGLGVLTESMSSRDVKGINGSEWEGLSYLLWVFAQRIDCVAHECSARIKIEDGAILESSSGALQVMGMCFEDYGNDSQYLSETHYEGLVFMLASLPQSIREVAERLDNSTSRVAA